MLKFSAVSQIWKKYIQKLNDWDLPLSMWPSPTLVVLASTVNFNKPNYFKGYVLMNEKQDKKNQICFCLLKCIMCYVYDQVYAILV